MLHIQFSFRKKFADSLKQDEAERPYISAHPWRITYIEELYILIIINLEIESFGAVIHLGTDYLIRKIKIKTVINIQKWASDREFFGIIVIFATYL